MKRNPVQLIETERRAGIRLEDLRNIAGLLNVVFPSDCTRALCWERDITFKSAEYPAVVTFREPCAARLLTAAVSVWVTPQLFHLLTWQ